MRALVVLALASCTLTEKVEPLEVRYFAPAAASPVTPSKAAIGTKLRLGRITSSAHLRNRIIHRDSAVELAPYEALRWSEQPALYVRRAASRALFETGAFDQAVGGRGPTLDLELVAFEEVRHAQARAGRVELRYELRDEQRVVARGDVICERPAAGATIELVVPAIAGALDAATADLAGRIATALEAPP